MILSHSGLANKLTGDNLYVNSDSMSDMNLAAADRLEQAIKPVSAGVSATSVDTDPVKRRRRGRPPLDAAHAVDESVLLSAAFAMFAERGYDATTMRELARRIGVSHNLLNVRFGRKQDLWRVAVDWRFITAMDTVIPAFQAASDPEQQLHDLIERFCDWAVANPDIVALSYAEGQRASWRLDYIIDRFIRPFQLRLDELLAKLRQVRPVYDISTGALMALLVHGVGFYFAARPMQERLDGSDMFAGDAPKHQARQMARFLINGLLNSSDGQKRADR